MRLSLFPGRDQRADRLSQGPSRASAVWSKPLAKHVGGRDTDQARLITAFLVALAAFALAMSVRMGWKQGQAAISVLQHSEAAAVACRPAVAATLGDLDRC